MKRLVLWSFVLFSFSIVNAEVYYTVADNTWSTDGINSCNCNPGLDDELFIRHQVDVYTSMEFDGKLQIEENGVLVAHSDFSFSEYSTVEVKRNGKIIYASNRFFPPSINNSMSFINDGEILLDGIFVNEGLIINTGTWDCSAGWFINNGIFNDLVGTGGWFNPYTCQDFQNSIPPTLPVEWDELSVTQDGTAAILSWGTFTEKNNDYFEVQTSLDGVDWVNVGYVNGKGDANEYSNYSYSAMISDNGIHYYRVKQVDFNGDYDFSNVAILNVESNEVVLYPNPLTENRLYISGEYKEIKVVDNLGADQEFEMIEDSVIFTNRLKQGTYYVLVQRIDGSVETFQLVKM